MRRSTTFDFAIVSSTLLTLVALSSPAEARLTRINAAEPILIDFPAFGRSGPYLKITGTFEGELDRGDPRNAVIASADLVRATVNAPMLIWFARVAFDTELVANPQAFRVLH